MRKAKFSEVADMPYTFRQTDILRIAQRDGRVSVDELAGVFDVTLQTIRRDLNDLTQSGVLERVHGGAIVPSSVVNIEYDQRRNLNATSKRSIAKTCATFIPSNASIFLGIGTTPEAIAHELLERQNLLVVTNNLHVVEIMKANEGCDVILTGGALRRTDNGLVGPCAVKTLEAFKFDISIIGCSGMDRAGDMFDFDMQEVVVNQAILRLSREVFLAADSSKCQRHAPFRVGSLKDVSRMFTDLAIPAGIVQLCQDWSVDLHTYSERV